MIPGSNPVLRVNLWAGEPYEKGIFGQFQHCSAILLSSRSDNVVVVNDAADNHVNPRFFAFARFGGKPLSWNGQMTIKDAEDSRPINLVTPLRIFAGGQAVCRTLPKSAAGPNAGEQSTSKRRIRRI